MLRFCSETVIFQCNIWLHMLEPFYFLDLYHTGYILKLHYFKYVNYITLHFHEVLLQIFLSKF